MDASEKLENCEPLEAPTKASAARLPRFRLFGDTMNTAARMMQKGLPGEVGYTSRDFSGNRTRKKGEKRTKNVKRWGWTPVGSGLGIYFLVNTWMNGWNTIILNDQIILWVDRNVGFPAICGVVSYDHLGRQVQFGDETLKYLPSWASTKPRGYVATWPIAMLTLAGTGGPGGMGFLKWRSSWGDEGKGQRHDPFAATLQKNDTKTLNWWKAERIRSKSK